MLINVSDDLVCQIENLTNHSDLDKEEILKKALSIFGKYTLPSDSFNNSINIFDKDKNNDFFPANPNSIHGAYLYQKTYNKGFIYHLKDCLYLMDLEGNFIDLNDAALALLGIRREDIPGINLKTLFDEKQAEFLIKKLRGIKENGLKMNYHEFTLKKNNGEPIMITVSMSLVYKDNKAFALYGLAHDISQQRVTEKALQKSEEKFLKAFHGNPLPMAITTIDEGRFIDANTAFFKILGYSREETIGFTVYDINLWKNFEERKILKNLDNKNPKLHNIKLQMLTKERKTLICRFAFEILEIDGVSCQIGVFEDITEIVKTEEELKSYRNKIEELSNERATRLSLTNKHLDIEISESEKYVQSLLPSLTMLDSRDEGIMVIDKNNLVLGFNKTAENILGFSSRNDICRPYTTIFIVVESNPDFYQRIDEKMNIINEKISIINASGHSIPLNVSTFSLKDINGQYNGFVCVFRDKSEFENLKNEIEQNYTFQGMVSKSPEMLNIFNILPDIAKSDSSILLEGPTGTGKNMLANAIHNLSTRKNKPFILIPCGNLPPDLFESELFGHVKGAFTDAKYDKPGKIITADGGTVFFDEIGDLPFTLQVKLLRLIEQHKFEPVGSTKTISVNIRIISATNKNLLDLVNAGKFRDDLYYRLSAIKIYSPPLKRRKEDIPNLIEYLLKKFNAQMGKNITGISDEAMKLLLNYSYPGNIRELNNIIEYSYVTCRDNIIHVYNLPPDLSKDAIIQSNNDISEKEKILEILNKCKGNKTKACEELKFSYTTLFRKLKKYNISL
jgi:PAS domain S-box-containing protein